MKKLFIGLGVIVVLLIAAVIIVPQLVPLESYKGEIQARAKEATGRDLRIDGPISLSLFPAIAISVEDVGFSNAPGATTPEMATIERLDVALQILPLISGEVVVDRFILERPVINLEVDAEGKANWDIQTGSAAPAADGGGSAAGSGDSGSAVSEISLGEVRLVDGTLSYIDRKGGQEETVSEINMELSLPSLSEPFAAEGSAVWKGETIALTVDAESPQNLMSGEASNLAMKVEAAPVTFSFDGAARNADDLGLQGQLALAIPSIRNLAAWTGNPLDFPGEGLGPFNLEGVLEMMGAKVALTDAKLSIDEIAADGLFSVDARGAKPMIKAELNVDQLNLNPYLPPESEDGTPSAGGSDGAAGSGGDAGQGGWSDEPIDVSALGALDADLAFNAGGIQFKEVKIGKSSLAVLLQDSKLTADLAEMQLYDGAGKGKIVVDGASGKPVVAADFDLANFQAGPFLSDLADFDRILGTTETQLSVTAAGGSQKELVSSLKGNGAVVFKDGAVKGINLAAMMRNISAAAIEQSFSDAEQTDFAELSGTFQIDKGIVSNKDLSLVAPLVRMTGEGTIPLPPKTIDYQVKPKLVSSLEGQGGQSDLSGIAVPIKVTGPWNDISYKPDLEGALKDQIKDPGALLEKVPEGGAKDLLDKLAPKSEGEGGSTSPLDLKKGLFGN
ncbi:AsmA family protein [Pelagibius litoralis]|uniref:AsmA family protein n=1 Tax=Pelagibius litoralis TaxID=374515 RepID=A0A967EXE7_9PROT|nr:AsmA family protein [Pelagibius litoralis]NIA69170.1 AsmA family protein [Pelagibius litoralis]